MTAWKRQGKQLLTLFTMTHCPVYIRWRLFTTLTPMQQIRRTARRHQFTPYPIPLRVILKCGLFLLWPFRAFLLALFFSREFGPLVVEHIGKSLWRQRLEQVALALGQFTSPEDYYRYEFYQAERRVLAGEYLQSYERQGLAGALNDQPIDDAIDDKLQFARVCIQYGIPSVPVLAVVDGSGIASVKRDSAYQLPRDNLFLKPTRGAQGEGSIRLQWVNSRYYQGQDGLRLTPQTLIDYLLRLGQERDYLVQSCVGNHPDVVTLTNGALATARIVTGRLPDGEIDLIAASFKMPYGQAITSTYGLHSAIDLDTGTLSKGYRYMPLWPSCEVHPDTGSHITGRMLPDWRRVIDLVYQVHQIFATYVFLGWDVAFTPDGPVVLEGNAGWDVPTVQLPGHKPLGQTRFVAVCLAHMLRKKMLLTGNAPSHSSVVVHRSQS